MVKYCTFYFLLFIVSCKSQPESNSNYDKYDPDKTYRLQLNPAAGSAYYYDITNESEMKLEVDDKKVANLNKINVGLIYKISKDSTGNFLFNMSYDKIVLHTKTGDKETDADADNASASIEPLDKILGILKNANFVAIIKPGGEIVNITGYKEIGEKIMASIPSADESSRNMIKSQLDKLVGDGLVKNNLAQLFKIFPDSAVHLKDSWKITSRQEGDFSMVVKGIYTLKAINSDFAIISVEGKITSENPATTVPGLSGGIATDLTGEQQGEFEMEAKTGMLISCKIKANIEGTIQAMGREIPIKIITSVKMSGRREK